MEDSNMEKTERKKEEAMARFMAAKHKKQAYLQTLEARMKAEYEQRTGQKDCHFEVLWTAR